MVNEVMKFITESDPEVGQAIESEAARQRRNLELIASENIVSEAVMMAMGTVLTNKYAEGYSGKRYYGGCQCVDVVETLAIERARKLFGCDYANVQPHSSASGKWRTRWEHILWWIWPILQVWWRQGFIQAPFPMQTW